jgi:tetratricopeptide (TPR) repeat protein/TolB-like protein/predicted Ser/Thr protein kinase
MGEVYLAEDTKLHRKVALKFLPAELTRDDERKQRFIQEARSAAGIQHPHIAAIYDVDEVDGRTFIAMEYVPGESLRELIRSKKLNLKRSLELGLQIAEGLAKAHEKGVVHRDVKPENVLISEDGYAKIIDFGLAKLVEQTASRDVPEEAETLLKTREGMVMGTVAYMSPEQALGEPLDARTDIFSLGAVLYEMLSGSSPFQRKSAVGTLSALLKESPPELTLPETTPPTELQQVLGKALAKERSERYASMKELAGQLRELRDRSVTVSQPIGAVSAPGRGKWLWVGGALAVAVLVAFAFYLGSWRAATPGIGASGRPAIAVMYFENTSGDEEIRWLSRGLPNMLVTDLAQTPGLDIVSSQRIDELLKQVGEENWEVIDRSVVSEIARRAGAGAVVMGSIFKSGDEIRIDVQLEDVATGRLLSAESVRGTDVFPMVDELTGRIRASLDMGDRPAGHAIAEITTPSLEAYQLYNEGLEASRNVRYLDARRLFEKAIEVDPSFAMAHYRLALTVLNLEGPGSQRPYLDKALEFQERLPERQSLQLQAADAWARQDYQTAADTLETLLSRYPDEEDAYVHLASIYRSSLHDDASAQATLERAVEAIPSSGHLHNALAYDLLGSSRYAEGIRELEKYASLSAGEPNPYDSLGDAYLLIGQPEKALSHFNRALEIDPSFYEAHGGLAWAYGMLGRYDEALKETEARGAFMKQEGLPMGSYFAQRAFLLSRVGRLKEAARDLADAVSAGEGKKGELADCALQAAVVAIEREDYPRALEQAARVPALLADFPIQSARDGRVMLADLLAGVAEARSGNLDAARTHLQAQSRYDMDTDWRRWWHGALAGEIALAEGDFVAAERAFTDGEAPYKMSEGRWDLGAGALPFRDGLARVTKARGDLAGAIAIYRALNTPDITNKWTSLLEPRFVLETARLLDQMGDKDAARAEYQRFLDLWKNADEGLPELAEGRAYLAQ